jgi:hypothetical protein
VHVIVYRELTRELEADRIEEPAAAEQQATLRERLIAACGV